uniref:Uncharacterized protein n=1 Tax=Tetranychus urticae TaxID=32264 RepID=T1JZN1_TETUR
MYDEYTYRLRLRVAGEIYNWSNQIYINHGENMRRQDIIAKENLYGVNRFSDLQHIIKNRDWINWTDLLGCKLGICCEKDHKEKIGVQKVSVELLNYSKFFDINYSLENPVTDWIDDVDFDNFNED